MNVIQKPRNDKTSRARVTRVYIEPICKLTKLTQISAKGKRRRPRHRREWKWPCVLDVPWAGYSINRTPLNGLEVLSWIPPDSQHLDNQMTEDHSEYVTSSPSHRARFRAEKRFAIREGGKRRTAAKPNSKNRRWRRLITK